MTVASPSVRATRSADAALVAIEAMIPSFQPVVSLVSGEVVGVEALARWPTVDGVDPAEVFALARARGVVSDVDFACRTAAIREARSARLTENLTLFLNFEPDAITSMARVEAHLDALSGGHDVVLEITERGLESRPDSLRAMVRAARRRGISIALDDVGANRSTLRALRIVEPDIVKLDARIVRHSRSVRAYRTLLAVRRYADSSGAVVLAEGIESARDRARAVELGATLGQGWLFGAATTGASFTRR